MRTVFIKGEDKTTKLISLVISAKFKSKPPKVKGYVLTTQMLSVFTGNQTKTKSQIIFSGPEHAPTN